MSELESYSTTQLRDLVLEAIRFGDRNLFEKIPNLDNTPVLIHFQSADNRFNKVENRGTIADYR